MIKAILLRDLQLARVSFTQLIISLSFFLSISLLMPIALDTSKELLSQVSGGLLWICAFLTILLNLERLFLTDKKDGTLDILLRETDFITFALFVFIKSLTHWLTTVMPLILISPFCALFFYMELRTLAATVLTLLIGSPALIFIGAAGAALTLNAQAQSKGLLFMMIIPFIIPIMIFAISLIQLASKNWNSAYPALYFLSSLSLFFAIIGPIAATLALKYSTE